MRLIIIIALIAILGLTLTGCNRPKPTLELKETREAEFISDQYGFKIMSLDGYSEDKSASPYTWNILTLRKDVDIRAQFGFVKGALFTSGIPGVLPPEPKQLLNDWAMGMLETPRFYAATTKSILNSVFTEVDGNTALKMDILLQFDQKLKEQIPEQFKKSLESEFKYFEQHPRALLRIYLLYRGNDMFHIEMMADPLTYQAEIGNFEKTIVGGLRFSQTAK